MHAFFFLHCLGTLLRYIPCTYIDLLISSFLHPSLAFLSFSFLFIFVSHQQASVFSTQRCRLSASDPSSPSPINFIIFLPLSLSLSHSLLESNLWLWTGKLKNAPLFCLCRCLYFSSFLFLSLSKVYGVLWTWGSFHCVWVHID